MSCTYKTRHTDCSTIQNIFTCDAITNIPFCLVIKFFWCLNLIFTGILLYQSYIYLVDRKISIKDPRMGIVLIAIILSCYNWLCYTFLKDFHYNYHAVVYLFTMNFFLYFFESLYFMFKALTFVKEKKSMLKKIFIT